MTRYQVIAHRRASSVFGAASAPLKEGDEVLPPFRSRYMAEALARGLDAKVGAAQVYHTVEEVPSAATQPVRDYAGLEIARMLVLTTVHLTRETANLMSSLPTAAFDKQDYGWFVYVTEETDQLPTDLEACIHYARSRSCEWLMFDCDGPTIDGLPVFDWEAARDHTDKAGNADQDLAERLRADARALDTGMDPELVRELHAHADRLDSRPTIDSMAEELRTYCREQQLPEYSADDLLFMEGLTEGQRSWLRDFCARWEAIIQRTDPSGGDDAVH